MKYWVGLAVVVLTLIVCTYFIVSAIKENGAELEQLHDDITGSMPRLK